MPRLCRGSQDAARPRTAGAFLRPAAVLVDVLPPQAHSLACWSRLWIVVARRPSPIMRWRYFSAVSGVSAERHAFLDHRGSDDRNIARSFVSTKMGASRVALARNRLSRNVGGQLYPQLEMPGDCSIENCVDVGRRVFESHACLHFVE